MRLAVKVMAAFALVALLVGLFVARVLVAEVKPGVRQAMEASLVDTANLLAELAADDMAADALGGGRFHAAVARAVARDPQARIWHFPKHDIQLAVRITDARGIVVYDSSGRDLGQDHGRWNDVLRTLRGEYGARSTPQDPGHPDGSSVMHVAAPVRAADGRLLGVLTVAQPNASMDAYIAAARGELVRKGLLLALLCALVGGAFSAWLAWRVGRLRRYAAALADGKPLPPPDRSRDELGQLAQALAHMRRQLDGKAYVERYVQDLTHEMKSPLAAITASAELLTAPMAEADRIQFAASIGEQAGRLNQMVERLLALAALEQHAGLADARPVDLVTLVHSVAADAGARAQQRQLAIRTDLPEAASVTGDAFLLRQALGNLVDNALEFADAGPVCIALQPATGGWQLVVADDGPGVPDYARDRIFDRFYSLPRPRSGQRSSGLGLNLVAEVARVHAGRAWLEPGPDAGTWACLWLPGAAAPTSP